jgi:hypothetical protein
MIKLGKYAQLSTAAHYLASTGFLTYVSDHLSQCKEMETFFNSPEYEKIANFAKAENINFKSVGKMLWLCAFPGSPEPNKAVLEQRIEAHLAYFNEIINSYGNGREYVYDWIMNGPNLEDQFSMEATKRGCPLKAVIERATGESLKTANALLQKILAKKSSLATGEFKKLCADTEKRAATA